MSDISNWTTSAGGNNFTPPDGWPEGMAPSAVNDTAREGMAAIRRWYIDAQWVNWGHVMVRQSNNSFLVSVTATDIYTAGRRLKLIDAGVTLYAETLASGMSGANTLVTISSTTNIDSSLSSGAVSILDPNTPAYRVDTYESYNAQLFVTVTSNTLNVYLKSKNGADPSASNPVWFKFRSATAANGDYTTIPAVAATSVSLPNGASLGTLNGAQHRLWISAVNDAGTVRLALFQALTATSLTVTTGTTVITPTALATLGDDSLISAVSNSAGNVSAGVFVATQAIASKAMRVLGYLESTQATAGTWATSPTKVQLWQPGMKLPGDLIQSKFSQVGVSLSGSTAFPIDGTVPQITEGDEFMTLAVTPTSAANLLVIDVSITILTGVSGSIGGALFQDAATFALASSAVTDSAGNLVKSNIIHHEIKAETASSTTFRVRAGGGAAGTNSFNSLMGGTQNNHIRVKELLT